MMQEFRIDYEDDTYFLLHDACETTEIPFQDPYLSTTVDLKQINSMVEEHMRTVHGVKKFDPTSCPSAADHKLVEFCGNCGYTNG